MIIKRLSIVFLVLIALVIVLFAARVTIIKSVLNSYLADEQLVAELSGDFSVSFSPAQIYIERAVVSSLTSASDGSASNGSAGLNAELRNIHVLMESWSIASNVVIKTITAEHLTVSQGDATLLVNDVELKDGVYTVEPGESGSQLSIAHLKFLDAELAMSLGGSSEASVSENDQLKKLASWKNVSLGAIVVSPTNDLSIGAVAITAPEVYVWRLADGSLLLPSMLSEAVSAEGTSDQVNSELGFFIERLYVNKGQVHLSDLSVEPVLSQQFTVKLFRASNINMSANEIMSWQLKLLQGERGSVNLQGSLMLSDPGQELSVDGNIENVSLPAFSGYSNEEVGYAIRSGQFNMEVDVKIINQKLDGKLNVDLFKTEFIIQDKDKVASFQQQLSTPLPAAFAALEDKAGHVKISVPVKGDLSDPQFGASGVFTAVTAKAVKSSAAFYLKSAVFPQTALVKLVEVAGGKAYQSLTALPKVEFSPVTAGLSDGHKKILDKASKLMAKKENLSLRLCSVAVEADGGDNSSRINVAKQRKQEVKTYLLASGSFNKYRMLDCLATLDVKKKAPYVELLF